MEPKRIKRPKRLLGTAELRGAMILGVMVHIACGLDCQPLPALIHLEEPSCTPRVRLFSEGMMANLALVHDTGKALNASCWLRIAYLLF